MRIGVLALQGAFIEHQQVLDALGIENFQIRQLKDIEQPFDGLILPGGESTVMGKLLHDLGLFPPLQTLIQQGLPTFGTCAGAILLAQNIVGDDTKHFALMDMTIERNAYGRQLGSFITDAPFGEDQVVIPMSFIRAPIIREVGIGTQILATINEDIVAAKAGNLLAVTFHPELKTTYVHEYFVRMIR